MRFRPFQITYETEGDKTVVVLHGRDERGEKRTVRVDGTEPHFYAEHKSPVCQALGFSLSRKDIASDPVHGFLDLPESIRKLSEELSQAASMVVRIEPKVAKDFISGKFLDKIVVKYPFDVPKIRDAFGKTWEADVLYENRVRYDLGIKAEIDLPAGCERLHRSQVRPIRPPRPGQAGVRPNGPFKAILPRLAVYDIETHDKGGFQGPEDARSPVVSIAAWDSQSDRYVCIFNGVLRQAHRDSLTRLFKKPHKGRDDIKPWQVQVVEVATEEALFETFNNWLRTVQPDALIGWNSDEYDDDYLRNRAQRIGAEAPDFDPLVLFDAEDGYVFSKYQRPESSALHYIATEYFGLPGKSTDKRIWQMMEGDRAELVFYNVNDVFLTKEIVLRSGIIDFYLRLAERAGTGLGRCFSTGHLVDSMVFHHLAGSGFAQPTKIKRTKKELEEWGKIKGAEVFDPASGLFENVIDLDNGGEYPELIRTFNMSPETIIEPAKWEEFERQKIPFVTSPNGNRYRLDKKGVFPILLTELIQDRAEAKAIGDQIGDDVNKKLSNTFYGVMPSPTYRMPDRRIGGDITGWAREHLKWNREFAQGWIHKAKALYGDTDSNLLVFVEKPDYETARSWGKDLASSMNASFLSFARQFGPVQVCSLVVKMDPKSPYDRFLQAGTKKKYACLFRSEKGDIERDGIKYDVKWRGFEIRRGDAAVATKEAQTSVLTEMLFGSSRSDTIERVNSLVRNWRSAPERDPAALWMLGKPKIVNKMKQVHEALRYSNTYLGTEFRKGDKPAMFYGYVAGNPKVDVFLWPWREALPPGTQLNMESTIDAVILTPLEGPLDLLDLRPSDCKNPVEMVNDWI